MITIYFPGHVSHFDGQFSDAEIQEGLKFLTERYPRPPFSRSRIVILREPGKLNSIVEEDAPSAKAPAKDEAEPKPLNAKAAEERRAGLLAFDLAYCEEWRVKRLTEMVDFMSSRRSPAPGAKP
jgi:hypothetical protein